MKIEIEATPTYWNMFLTALGKARVNIEYQIPTGKPFTQSRDFNSPTEAAKWIEEVFKEG